MALKDLTGQQIQHTYQKVVQTDGTNQLADGTGSIFIPVSASYSISASHAVSASYAISASHEITYELSSSYAQTASMASNNFIVQGDTTASGDISSSGDLYAKYLTLSTPSIDDGSETGMAVGSTFRVGATLEIEGSINASGNIVANNFQSSGGDVAGISFTDDMIITGHVTASGNISSSGIVYANSFKGEEGGNAAIKLPTDKIQFKMGLNEVFTFNESNSFMQLGYAGTNDIWLGSGATLLQHTDITNARTDFAYRVRIAPKNSSPNDNAMLNKSTLYVSGSTYLDGPISSSVIIDAPGVDDDGSGGGMTVGSTFQVGAALEVKGNVNIDGSVFAKDGFFDATTLYLGGTPFSKAELDTLKEGKTINTTTKDLGEGDTDKNNIIRPNAIMSPVDDSTYQKFTLAGRVGQFVGGHLYFDQNAVNDTISLGKTNNTQLTLKGNITASGNISASGTITATEGFGTIDGGTF